VALFFLYSLQKPALIWALWVGLCLFVSSSPENLLTPRWDGVHYVSIAERGYELHPCGPHLESQGFLICGNPWFPGWSYWNWIVSKAISIVSDVPLEKLFAFNGAILTLVLLCLLYRFPDQLLTTRASSASSSLGLWACLGIVMQPGSFYFLTQFPYAFVLLTGFLFLLLYRKPGAKPLAALLGSWYSMAYPTGALFVVFPLADSLKARDLKKRAQALGWCAIFLFGILFVSVLFKIQFNDFWLYFKHNAQYPVHGSGPVSVILDLLSQGHVNERLTFLWYALGFLLILLRFKGAAREPAVYFVAAVLFFSPSTGRWICIYRHYLLCLPLGALIGTAELRPFWKLAFFAAGGYLQFFAFLPKYQAGNLM
jgi:hypothetical protein